MLCFKIYCIKTIKNEKQINEFIIKKMLYKKKKIKHARKPLSPPPICMYFSIHRFYLHFQPNKTQQFDLKKKKKIFFPFVGNFL